MLDFLGIPGDVLVLVYDHKIIVFEIVSGVLEVRHGLNQGRAHAENDARHHLDRCVLVRRVTILLAGEYERWSFEKNVHERTFLPFCLDGTKSGDIHKMLLSAKTLGATRFAVTSVR